MKKLFLLAGLFVAGCASVQPYYEAQNYQQLGWAKTTFEQSKAICRDANLQHQWMGDTYELETPKYKACMEKEGYHFQDKKS
jgi:hypothetical protein